MRRYFKGVSMAGKKKVVKHCRRISRLAFDAWKQLLANRTLAPKISCLYAATSRKQIPRTKYKSTNTAAFNGALNKDSNM